jgi:hypothetical protein
MTLTTAPTTKSPATAFPSGAKTVSILDVIGNLE